MLGFLFYVKYALHNFIKKEQFWRKNVIKNEEFK